MMEIWINGERASFTLENERTLAEVLRQIEAWAEEQQFFIHEVTVDGKIIPDLFGEGAEGILVETTRKLELSIAPPTQVAYQGCLEIERYTTRVVGEIGTLALTRAAVAPLFDGLGWMRQVSSHVLKALQLDTEKMRIEHTLKSLEIEIFRLEHLVSESFSDSAAHTNEKWSKIKSNLEAIYRQLMAEVALIRQKAFVANSYFLLSKLNVSDAKGFLEREGREIATLLAATLPQAAEEIQKGRDGQAMSSVEAAIQLFGLIAQLLERAGALAGREPANSALVLREAIKAKLADLESAFQHRDMVMLSDLLEYELAELLPLIEGALTDTAAFFK